jgi:hypothetical protein
MFAPKIPGSTEPVRSYRRLNVCRATYELHLRPVSHIGTAVLHRRTVLTGRLEEFEASEQSMSGDDGNALNDECNHRTRAAPEHRNPQYRQGR